ncbi:unnamed protein product [Clavelina lepadiformis]|uniref:Sushi, von Willebrand factor type A, EGF and pentraxin domain-containing protein 1 n=1 Tax=Clavelina lepadiformis TaxID=159417 RepID=A0ABP0G722_CLALP
MTNSLVNFIVYSAREQDFRNEVVETFRPGYLKQLSVQSGAQTPRKGKNSKLEDSPHSPATSTLIEPCLQDPVRLVSLSVVTFSKPNPPIGGGNPPFLPGGDRVGDPPYDLNKTISHRCLGDCNNPPSVAHARISPTSKRENSQTRYLCDPGYYTSNFILIQCIQREWISLKKTSQYLISQFKLILPTCIEPVDACLATINFAYNAGKDGMKTANAEQSLSSNKRRNKRKLAVLKTITIMQIGFRVTLVPLAVAGILIYSDHLDCYNFAQTYMVCFYLNMTNSLVNFIVYSAREQDFRNEIVDIFKPGYLKQLSVPSSAQTPRKSENAIAVITKKNIRMSSNWRTYLFLLIWVWSPTKAQGPENDPYNPIVPIPNEPCFQHSDQLVPFPIIYDSFLPDPIACLAPPPPPDGAVLLSADEISIKDTYSLGTEVIYICEDPCSTHVIDTFTCTRLGWIGEFSSCPLHCNNPPSVANASIFPTTTREGSQARYFCDPGYYTSDVTLIQCIRGEWISLEEQPSSLLSQYELIFPTCIEPTDGCGSPPLLINSIIEPNGDRKSAWSIRTAQIQKYDIDDKIIYSCIDGYYLNAPAGPVSTCLVGNRWSLNESASNFPICVPDCGNPPQATNATIRVFSTIEGSVAHYICNEGLSTNDVTTATCRRNGNFVSWDLVQLPQCTNPENGCGNPPMINNGYAVRLPPYKESDIVTYDCFQGYELVAPGGSYVVCRQNKWANDSESPMFPFCRRVCLSLPTLPPGGVVLVDETLRNKDGISFSNGVEHSFGCQPGYRLVRDATLTCVEGNWNWTVNGGPALPPLCYRGCVQPPPEATFDLEIVDEPFRDTFGFRFGSIVTYGCKEGSTLVGSTTISCSNEMWLPDIPTCVQNCSAPPPVPNSKFRRTSNSEAQSYEYVCDPGFITNDITITNCLDDGTWSLTRLPECTAPKQGCGSPAPLQNGKYSGEAPFAEGAKVTYRCKDDFRMVAPNGAVSTCQAGNKWSLKLNPGNFPECRLDCKTAPPRPKYGVLILNEPVPDNNGFYATGSTFIYGCDADWNLTGPNVSICLGNDWIPNILDLYCVFVSLDSFIPDTYAFYGPRRALDVAKTNDFIQPYFSISSNMTNYTATNRTNSSDLILITSVCGYPGFCVGSPPDIYFKCSNQTLFECEACGVGRAASFLFFVLLLSLTIFFGNALVIWVSYKRFNRKRANKMDICKLSLAVADILTGIQILVVVSFNFTWTMNSTPVELIQQQSALQRSPQAYVGGIFFLFTLTSSLFHLVYMGGERLYAIVKPIHYKWQKKTSVYVGLGVVWFLSFLSATVPAMFRYRFKMMLRFVGFDNDNTCAELD